MSAEVAGAFDRLPFQLRIPLKFSPHSLLLPLIIHFSLLLFKLFFARFLIDLSLQRVFHFLLLRFSLRHDDLLFVTTLEDGSLLL